jgi:chemotaxis protein methyltransferase CheR
VAEHVSRLVSFHRINLVESWPWVAKFDVIFCRNVMIYFDKCVREQVVERLRDALLPGGILVLGSSESLSDLNIGGMRMLQASVYRREAA